MNQREERWDPIKIALQRTFKLKEIIEICTPEAERLKTRALPRRAKDLPQLILQLGLIPALTFYLSKVEDKELYKALVDSLSGKKKFDTNLCRALQKEVEEEGKGYTALLATIASTLPLIKVSLKSQSQDLNSLPSLASYLLTIRDEGKDLVIEKSLISFLVELKKLFEAFFGE